MTRVLILGAGGHGRVVLDALRALGTVEPVGFLDDARDVIGTTVSGLAVLGPNDALADIASRTSATAAIVAIGANAVRRAYTERIAALGLTPLTAIHPTAIVSASATLGRGTLVCAGAIVGAEARLGDSVILNTGAQVDHECEIADGVHIAPGAILGGRVRVGADVFVGLGSRVIQCLAIGEGATVGAGAVVIRDVTARTTVVGIPARITGA